MAVSTLTLTPKWSLSAILGLHDSTINTVRKISSSHQFATLANQISSSATVDRHKIQPDKTYFNNSPGKWSNFKEELQDRYMTLKLLLNRLQSRATSVSCELARNCSLVNFHHKMLYYLTDIFVIDWSWLKSSELSLWNCG